MRKKTTKNVTKNEEQDAEIGGRTETEDRAGLRGQRDDGGADRGEIRTAKRSDNPELRQKLKRIGGLKLWEMMKDMYPEGWVPGRDRFFEILRQNRLLAAACTHEALLQAIAQTGRDDLHDVIHHSDRGTQYCCDLYVGELKRHNIMISMTEDSNPTDNGIAERVNGIIKQELIYPNRRFRDMAEARERIGEFIAFYNEKRPHMSLGMQTPAEVHACQTGAQRRCWKTYRRRFPSDVIESSTV